MTTRRKKWIAATVAMIALAGSTFVFSRPREPHYEGRSLTYWAARLNQPEAQQALSVAQQPSLQQPTNEAAATQAKRNCFISLPQKSSDRRTLSPEPFRFEKRRDVWPIKRVIRFRGQR